MAISYLETITLAPARCAQMLSNTHERTSRLGRVVERAWHSLERGYTRALTWALRHPWKVLGAAVAVMGLSVLAALRVPAELVPAQDQSRLSVRLNTETGSTLAAATPLLERAEQIVLGHPEVDRVLTQLSGGGGSMTLTWCAGQARQVGAGVMADLRKELSARHRLARQHPGPVAAELRRAQRLTGGLHRPRRGGGRPWSPRPGPQGRPHRQRRGHRHQHRLPDRFARVSIIPDRRAPRTSAVTRARSATWVSALIGGNVAGKFSTAAAAA